MTLIRGSEGVSRAWFSRESVRIAAVAVLGCVWPVALAQGVGAGEAAREAGPTRPSPDVPSATRLDYRSESAALEIALPTLDDVPSVAGARRIRIRRAAPNRLPEGRSRRQAGQSARGRRLDGVGRRDAGDLRHRAGAGGGPVARRPARLACVGTEEPRSQIAPPTSTTVSRVDVSVSVVTATAGRAAAARCRRRGTTSAGHSRVCGGRSRRRCRRAPARCACPSPRGSIRPSARRPVAIRRSES